MQTLSFSDILQKKFVGTDDFRRGLTDILNKLPKEGEIVITQHGKPQAVLIDLESYLNILETFEDIHSPGFIDSIYQGVKEIDEGKGLTMKELKKRLKL